MKRIITILPAPALACTDVMLFVEGPPEQNPTRGEQELLGTRIKTNRTKVPSPMFQDQRWMGVFPSDLSALLRKGRP